MTLVLGAMDGELEAVIRGMTVGMRSEWRGFRFAQGSVAGVPVVVSRTGAGKTLSAMVTGYMINRFRPRRILCVGLAGALRDDLEVGDVVVARDTIQHDVDASACGFAPGRIPGTGYRELACDPLMLAVARAIDPPQGRAICGRVLTGDRFVDDPGERAALARDFGGDAVEMEGASIGLVATVHEIPYLVIRTISDVATGGASGSASGAPVPREYLRAGLSAALCRAGANSWHYVRGMLEALRGEGEQTRL